MNPTTMRDITYAIQSRTDYIESSYLGNKINTLQSKMSEKLRNHATENRVTGHIAGSVVAVADFVLDLAKYPLVTIEHLAKAILEPLGIILKKCSGGKMYSSCTMMSSAKHLGYGVKGAIYTFFSPLIGLGLLLNYNTIINPTKAASGWELTIFADEQVKRAISAKFPD